MDLTVESRSEHAAVSEVSKNASATAQRSRAEVVQMAVRLCSGARSMKWGVEFPFSRLEAPHTSLVYVNFAF